jgi:hypothetical protein
MVSYGTCVKCAGRLSGVCSAHHWLGEPTKTNQPDLLLLLLLLLPPGRWT